MNRIIISLPEELELKLRACAAERRVSIAEFVREAVEAKVAQEQPRPKSLGIGASDRARPPIDWEEPTPGGRSFDHIMGRGAWATERTPAEEKPGAGPTAE